MSGNNFENDWAILYEKLAVLEKKKIDKKLVDMLKPELNQGKYLKIFFLNIHNCKDFLNFLLFLHFLLKNFCS